MYTDRASMATVAFVQKLIVDSCLEFTLSLVSLKRTKKKKKKPWWFHSLECVVILQFDWYGLECLDWQTSHCPHRWLWPSTTGCSSRVQSGTDLPPSPPLSPRCNHQMIGLESPFPVVVIIYHLRWLLKHSWIRSESIFVPNVGYSSDWVGFIMQVHIYHLSFNPRPSGTKYVDIFAMEFYLLQTCLEWRYWGNLN